MIADFKKRLMMRISAARNSVIESTGTGSAGSYEDYRYRVGIETGFQRALDMIQDIYREFMNDDDEVDDD